MKEIIFHCSILVFPFLYFLYKYKKISNFKKIFLIILSFIFIYSRFIEPQIIITKQTNINLWFETKIALISDLHIWIFKKQDFVKKIVNKINSLDVDYVFIAWDLTYYPKQKNIKKLFKDLQYLKHPTYYVLWNHDVWKPGDNIRWELEKVLLEYNLILLNNKEINLWNFKLLWLWSNWNNEDKIELLNNYTPFDNIIVLTHNPDTTNNFTNKNADLTLCWHTHWWQIKIPFIYKKMIPTLWAYNKWLSQEKNTTLFTSSWIWETWLSMRLFNFPVIDIINIKK